MRTERLLPDQRGIARAASLLRQGELVAFATETVYGLGADATNEAAVASLYAAKGRPRCNPLICHYDSAMIAFSDVIASPLAHRLAQEFWPGPLTLVLPRSAACSVASLVAAGLATLAVRVPGQSAARDLCRAAGRPIAAPSANTSGRLSPTTCAHVLAEFDGRIPAILDAGPTTVGLESTVLDLSGATPMLLRPGGLPAEVLAAVTGPLASPPPGEASPGEPPRAPGMLASHYAPHLPLRLDAGEVAGNEALLAFGTPIAGAGLTFNLSARADLAEAATRLFAGLNFLDCEGRRLGLAGIAAMPIPHHGLGVAIADRLARAAAPRSTPLSFWEKSPSFSPLSLWPGLPTRPRVGDPARGRG